VYWDSGTAHLLPRLLRLPDGTTRTRGPLFLSERRPVPARRPAATDICPHTGRARLGYDRARVLLEKHTRLDLHQLRHSVTTHLGEAEVPLQLIMGKTRHKNPAPPCATSNPAPKPSPPSPSILLHPGVDPDAATSTVTTTTVKR
jgi:hypothetical protein